MACAILPPRLVPTSRGRGCGIGGAPDEAVPKTGGRGKPLPYEMTGKAVLNGGRAATEGRPYGDLRPFHRSQQNRIGSVAAAATVPRRTEIAP